MVREEMRDGFEFVPMFYPFYKKDAIKVVNNGAKSLEEYQKYICTHGIEKAEIIMPDLKILKLCPSLKYLNIFPIYTADKKFDFSPLYEVPEIKALNCQNRYEDSYQYLSELDYLKVRGLISLFVDVNSKTLNYNKVETLRSLSIGSYKGKKRDVTELFCSKELDTLRIIQCGIDSLTGIERSFKMQCVYLDYNRSLKDISALMNVKETLKMLRIDNCPKIENFSILGELENLELLELTGSNTLPNLNFLKTMKNLKTFILNMNVLNGDLSLCMNLSYVHLGADRKHYNLKNNDLPKLKYFRGNEDIEEWRRLE